MIELDGDNEKLEYELNRDILRSSEIQKLEDEVDELIRFANRYEEIGEGKLKEDEKEWEKRSKTLTAPSGLNPEQLREEFEKDKALVEEVKPLLVEAKEIVHRHKLLVKKNEADAQPLADKMAQICVRARNPAEEINRLVQPLLRSGVELYEKKMVENSIKKLRKAVGEYNRLKEEHRELDGKVNSLRVKIQPPELPPTKLDLLFRFKPKLAQKVVGNE